MRMGSTCTGFPAAMMAKAVGWGRGVSDLGAAGGRDAAGKLDRKLVACS